MKGRGVRQSGIIPTTSTFPSNSNTINTPSANIINSNQRTRRINREFTSSHFVADSLYFNIPSSNLRQENKNFYHQQKPQQQQQQQQQIQENRKRSREDIERAARDAGARGG